MLTPREFDQVLTAISSTQGLQLGGVTYVPMGMVARIVASFADPVPTVTMDEEKRSVSWAYKTRPQTAGGEGK